MGIAEFIIGLAFRLRPSGYGGHVARPVGSTHPTVYHGSCIWHAAIVTVESIKIPEPLAEPAVPQETGYRATDDENNGTRHAGRRARYKHSVVPQYEQSDRPHHRKKHRRKYQPLL